MDTIRSLRALALSHLLGHRLLEEQDASVSLLERLIEHARATARYAVYYGTGRDTYDVRGRVAHESLFNAANGTYRGPNSQQGYSPFSTWTRGLAWAMLGFAEQLEFLARSSTVIDLRTSAAERRVERPLLDAARATCDFYIDSAAAADGVPYWDTGAPGLAALGDWTEAPVRSVQRSRAGGQLRRGDCGAGPAPTRTAARGARRRRFALRAGGPRGARDADRRRSART